MAAKFHLCLLLIILGTIAVQGARPGKPYFLPRQLGSDCASIHGTCKPLNEYCPFGECQLQTCPGFQEKCCCPPSGK